MSMNECLCSELLLNRLTYDVQKFVCWLYVTVGPVAKVFVKIAYALKVAAIEKMY